MKIHMSFVAIGLGLGWLAGLSLSPVISTIISGLLALVASSLAFLTNIKLEKSDKEMLFNDWGKSIFYMAFLMCGLVFGSACGIYAREHNVFGPSATKMAGLMKGAVQGREESRKKIIESIEEDVALFKKLVRSVSEESCDSVGENINEERCADEKSESAKMIKAFIEKRAEVLLNVSAGSYQPEGLVPTRNDSVVGLASGANIRYGKSGLYANEQLCDRLLNQSQNVSFIKFIELNRDDENYRYLAELLDEKKNQGLDDAKIITKLQEHIEGKCL